jgi:hypothetical protein
MRKSLGRVKGYNWQPSFLTKHGEISQDTGASFDSIKVGMTINEVEVILAKATSKIEEIYGFMKLWARSARQVAVRIRRECAAGRCPQGRNRRGVVPRSLASNSCGSATGAIQIAAALKGVIRTQINDLRL